MDKESLTTEQQKVISHFCDGLRRDCPRGLNVGQGEKAGALGGTVNDGEDSDVVSGGMSERPPPFRRVRWGFG